MHSKSAPRRQHSAELKAEVLAACDEPGASISAVALARGLNANLVRKWREGRGLKRVGLVAPSSPRVATSTPLIAGANIAPPFVKLMLPGSQNNARIRR